MCAVFSHLSAWRVASTNPLRTADTTAPTSTSLESRRGRPRSGITDCFDNLLDCVRHQLWFRGLNVMRALGCDFVFGVRCKRRQRVLRCVPCLIECSWKIGGQRLPRTRSNGWPCVRTNRGMGRSGSALAAFSIDPSWRSRRASRCLYIFRGRASVS